MSSVPIESKDVIDEYHRRLASLFAENIRLTLVERALIKQRDDALRNWESIAHKYQDMKQKYGEPETLEITTGGNPNG